VKEKAKVNLAFYSSNFVAKYITIQKLTHCDVTVTRPPSYELHVLCQNPTLIATVARF